jgi:hypothetical protein
MTATNTPAADLPALFDGLKSGQIVTIAFTSCMAHSKTDGVQFRVGRRSHSKKYNVTTIALRPADDTRKGPAQFKLYKRSTGVTMAHGNMGVVLKSISL